jgi:hypothetical protein
MSPLPRRRAIAVAVVFIVFINSSLRAANLAPLGTGIIGTNGGTADGNGFIGVFELAVEGVVTDSDGDGMPVTKFASCLRPESRYSSMNQKLQRALWIRRKEQRTIMESPAHL